jgi:hypothetical protein
MKKPNRSFFTLAVGCLSFFVLGNTFAADYFPMIVRGGPGVTTSYTDGVLTVHIRKAHNAAGSPLDYGKLPVGSAAWVDRPLNDQEPWDLKQRIDQNSARDIMQWLRGSDAYWKFFCSNTRTGYFDVLRSEKASRAVRID